MSLGREGEYAVTAHEEKLLVSMAKRKVKFSVELEFHGQDLFWARKWAEKHGYAYDDPHRMLMDAALSGEVDPIQFREVVSFGVVD